MTKKEAKIEKGNIKIYLEVVYNDVTKNYLMIITKCEECQEFYRKQKSYKKLKDAYKHYEKSIKYYKVT